MSDQKIWTKAELIQHLSEGGVAKGCLLHLKVSIKAIGKIAGGAQTLLDALLYVVGPEGTLVIDSFISSFPLPLSEEHANSVSNDKTTSYAGALANVMIQHPDMVRSKHPIQRYTAIGKLAHELMDNHTSASGAYDPLDRMAEMGALNLSIGKNTIGVGTTHVAIEKCNFTKKPTLSGVNYLTDDGSIKFFQANWNGGCAKGFPKFIPLYEQDGCLKWIKIGYADAVLTDMKGTLATELKQLQLDPGFFFCDDPTCKDCRLNWGHSTGNYWMVKYHSLIKILRSKLKR